MYVNPCLKFWQCLIIFATSEPLWVIWNRRRYWPFCYVVTSTQLNSAYHVIFSLTAACNGGRLDLASFHFASVMLWQTSTHTELPNWSKEQKRTISFVTLHPPPVATTQPIFFLHCDFSDLNRDLSAGCSQCVEWGGRQITSTSFCFISIHNLCLIVCVTSMAINIILCFLGSDHLAVSLHCPTLWCPVPKLTL